MLKKLWLTRPPNIIEIIIIVILTLAIALIGALAAEAPDEQTKIEALKLGYILNGNSMVRWGSLDLTTAPDLTAPKGVRTIPINPSPKKKDR